MRLHKPVMVLAAVGLADLISTLYLVYLCGAAEANPIMAHFLAVSPLLFVAVKIGLLAGAIGVLEYAWSWSPRRTSRAVVAGIAAYVGIYIAGVAHVNNQPNLHDLPERTVAQMLEFENVKARARNQTRFPVPSWALAPPPSELLDRLPAARATRPDPAPTSGSGLDRATAERPSVGPDA